MIIPWPWLLAGFLLGCFHSTALWRSAKHPTAWTAVLGMIRLLTVGAVLAIAAMRGGILPAAGGWAAGFFLCVLVVLCRRTR